MNSPQLIRQLKTAGIFFYSLLVIATAAPGGGNVSAALVVPYYLIVPGYCIALLFRKEGSISDYALSSFAWSVALLASVYSLKRTFPSYYSVPTSIVVPILTLLLLVYDYLHGR
ncbi:MAG TPA: hypothetical protein VEJ36_06240 [Nitrososphaerales archaeon]|nr:hypothetical protein [Nitrososphaerales archaeon]